MAGVRTEYTPARVYRMLVNWQRLVQGARLPCRDDRLGTRSAPAEEAPWSATARMKADIEKALQSVAFERAQITFDVLARGGGGPGARYRAAEWWGLTPGQVSAIVTVTLQSVSDWLNGGADLD